MSHLIEKRIVELGISLPVPPKSVANYVASTRFGNLLIVSGQLCLSDGTLVATGLADDVPAETAAAAARACAVNILAQVRAALGDLDRVTQVHRLGGFIAASAGFSAHATIMNGASDLMVEVFGEAGRHARSTVGVASLPLNATVEIEAMLEFA